MKIVWSVSAWSDADRLHSFAAQYDHDAADAIFDRLAAAPTSLLDFPRRGTKLEEYAGREVRELGEGRYVLRYEITNNDIFVLRIFHAKEDRF